MSCDIVAILSIRVLTLYSLEELTESVRICGVS